MGDLNSPFTFSGGSLREDEWDILKSLVLCNNVQSVLEVGAGFSTVLLAWTVPYVLSFDTSPEWAQKVCDEIGKQVVMLYKYPIFPDIGERFDFALVDGPTGCSDGRRESLEFAKQHADVILIHDYGRDKSASELVFGSEWVHHSFKARFGIAMKKTACVMFNGVGGETIRLHSSYAPSEIQLSPSTEEVVDTEVDDGLDDTLRSLLYERQRTSVPKQVEIPPSIPVSETDDCECGLCKCEPGVCDSKGCKSGMQVPDGYIIDQYGFIKQVDHHDFEYSIEYKEKQSTNLQMSFLRLGWLAAHFDYAHLKSFKMVDVGCGSGVFAKFSQDVFRRVYCYDVVGASISAEILYGEQWDLVVLSDVLEHFQDIDRLFDMHWRYAMVSFPETPNVATFDELRAWKHFKPNEHLYYLTLEGVKSWVENKGKTTKVIANSNFEDLIRVRWDEGKPNITTVLIER